MMRLRQLIGFTRTLLLMGLLSSASLVSAEGTGYTKPPTEKVTIDLSQLDIHTMVAEWWRGLESAPSDNLKGQLTNLQSLLQSEWSKLSIERQANISNSLESIQANIQAYLSLHDKPATPTPKPDVYAEVFEFEAWQDRLQKVRREQDSLSITQSSLAQSQTQYDALTQSADDSAAHYLAHQERNEDKIELAFDMIEQRLAWLVTAESLRLHKSQFEAQAQRLQQAKEAFQIATARLQIDANKIKQLSDKLLVQQQVTERYRDALRAAQAAAVVVWGEDDMNRIKGLLQQSEAVKAEVAFHLSQAQALFLAPATVYARLYVANEYIDHDKEIRHTLPLWQKDIEGLQHQRKEDRNRLEFLRDQIQTYLLSLSENPPENYTAKQMAQLRQQGQQALQAINTALADIKTVQGSLLDAEQVMQLLSDWLLTVDGVWVNRWHMLVLMGQESVQLTRDLLTMSLFKVGDAPVTTFGLMRVIVFITLAWWLSYWLRKALAQIAKRNEKIAQHTAYTLGRVVHYVVMIIGTVVALSSIGIDFSNVAWIAGALSVGIGFGLQSVVNNFVSGLIVMFERTLKVGDFIELPSGVSGTVKEIRLRSTLITTGDNLEIVVPNAEFMTGRVVNWTLSDLYRRIHVPFSVSLESDKREVVEAVLVAAKNVPYTLYEEGREPKVVLISLDGKMSFELLVWLKQGAVKHFYGEKPSYLWQIENALSEREIKIV